MKKIKTINVEITPLIWVLIPKKKVNEGTRLSNFIITKYYFLCFVLLIQKLKKDERR